VAYVGLEGWADSERVGWIVLKGAPAFWKTEVPIFSSSAHTYQFDSYSKWSSYPRLPHSGPVMGAGVRKGFGGLGDSGGSNRGSQWKRVSKAGVFERVA
jgi:hypothetical protein